MGELVPADDGLPAEGNVGPWVEDKYHALREYLRYHAKARAKFEHRAYVEVFCGPGCIQLRETGQFIDGSPVRENAMAPAWSGFGVQAAAHGSCSCEARRVRLR